MHSMLIFRLSMRTRPTILQAERSSCQVALHDFLKLDNLMSLLALEKKMFSFPLPWGAATVPSLDRPYNL